MRPLSQLFSWRVWLSVAAGIVALQALVLWTVGQPLICECGVVKFWEGTVLGPGNSQHLFDWYTPSHVIHGFLFYLLLWGILPKSQINTWVFRLMIAVGLEVSWEVLENSPMIIDRYRQTALAQGYTGDSVINSVFDTLAMAGGFVLARRYSIGIIVGLAIAMELFTGYMIRDGLAFNVISIIHPIEAINEWQANK